MSDDECTSHEGGLEVDKVKSFPDSSVLKASAAKNLSHLVVEKGCESCIFAWKKCKNCKMFVCSLYHSIPDPSSDNELHRISKKCSTNFEKNRKPVLPKCSSKKKINKNSPCVIESGISIYSESKFKAKR